MSFETLEKRFTDLQDRLAVLQDATNQLKGLIDRLANFDFQPGSVPVGASDDDNVCSEINQILREQEEELELLQEEIIDIRPGRSGGDSQHDRVRLKDGANRLEHELQNCRKAFRRAQISAKRNLRLARRQERELLYASFSNPRSGVSPPAVAETAIPLPSRRKTQKRSEMTKEEQMISASNDITESMRRAHDLMAAELSKSDFAHNTLKESTASLSQLSENYSSLDTMLSNSRALLSTLLKSQKTDTWYLQSAFYLLIVTIGWLIFRRLLWGPTWWLVWLPLKLIFRGTVGMSNTISRRTSQGVGSGSDSATIQSLPHLAQMNNEGVPTAQVVQPSQNPQEPSGSIIEKINKVSYEKEPVGEYPQENGTGKGAQEDQQEETVLRDRDVDEPPNPKKRMMEEDASGQQGDEAERVRDEL
ncbi:Sec20-domain-containing protein [Rostrohypoxylon terebratum]|nr:Sec20-domain-containing protein [Rostrohypoxylon terebratum]